MELVALLYVMNNIALTVINLAFNLKISHQPSYTSFMSDKEWDAHLHEQFHSVCIDLMEAFEKIEDDSTLDLKEVKNF